MLLHNVCIIFSVFMWVRGTVLSFMSVQSSAVTFSGEAFKMLIPHRSYTCAEWIILLSGENKVLWVSVCSIIIIKMLHNSSIDAGCHGSKIKEKIIQVFISDYLSVALLLGFGFALFRWYVIVCSRTRALCPLSI